VGKPGRNLLFVAREQLTNSFWAFMQVSPEV